MPPVQYKSTFCFSFPFKASSAIRSSSLKAPDAALIKISHIHRNRSRLQKRLIEFLRREVISNLRKVIAIFRKPIGNNLLLHLENEFIEGFPLFQADIEDHTPKWLISLQMALESLKTRLRDANLRVYTLTGEVNPPKHAQSAPILVKPISELLRPLQLGVPVKGKRNSFKWLLL